MKTKTLIFVLLVCVTFTRLSSQTYSVIDSLALLAIDSSCDASDSLNWDTEPDPGNWNGVTWNTDNPKRVSELYVNNKSLTGAMDVSSLTSLASLQCSYNKLTSLDISELTSITYMTCYYNQLTSLDVSALVNLYSLSCRNNQLTSLDVSTLIDLEFLRCNNNQLTVLDLSASTNLTYLDCSDNQLTELDVSSLIKLSALKFWGNQLTNLDVSALTNLTTLTCHENQLTKLDVSALTNLTELYCSDNQLTALDVSALTNLTILQCYGNRLPFSSLATGLHVGDYTYSPQDILFDPQSISGNTTIDYSVEALIDGTATQFVFYKDGISVESNITGLFTTTGPGDYHCTMTNAKLPVLTLTTANVTVIGASPTFSVTDSLALLAIDDSCDASDSLNWDTEPNPGNWVGVTWNTENPKRVAELRVYNKSLTGAMVVTALTNLTYLDCTYNQLTGLDASTLTDLTYLSCYNNQLTALDVSELINLTNLICSTNLLTVLDVSKLVNLTYLGCGVNQLNVLDVSDLVNLTYLGCNVNQLTVLDVSHLTNLTELYCQANQLTSLDVSELTNLTLLSCYSNQLTSLNVSALTNLTELDCQSNQISILNVSELYNLTQLYCYNNHLTGLEVSALTNLISLGCSNNQLTTLNVLGLSNLIFLNCSDNYLTTLDVSDLTKLTTLSCVNNQLTTLDVSTLMNLPYLSCSGNQLTTLDVSALTNLSYFYCAENQLATLDVSALTNLAALECYGNRLPFSSLATGLHVGIYTYSPQDTLYKPQSISGNTIIDYSTEALIAGTATQFVFFKDGSEAESNTTGLFTTTGNGEYHCTMTNVKFPDLTLTTAIVTVTEATKVEPMHATGFSLYPNPVKDKINFSSPEKITGISVFSLNGIELITTDNVTNGIDVSSLTKGTYLILLKVDDKIQLQKIVIE